MSNNRTFDLTSYLRRDVLVQLGVNNPTVSQSSNAQLFEYFAPKLLIFGVLCQIAGFYNCRNTSAAKYQETPRQILSGHQVLPGHPPAYGTFLLI